MPVQEISVESSPAIVHLSWPSGDTPSFTFNFGAIDLSVPTFTSEFRQKDVDATKYSFTIDTTNAATGTLVLTAPTFADNFTMIGVWDLRSNESGDIITWIEGRVTLSATVTDVTP